MRSGRLISSFAVALLVALAGATAPRADDDAFTIAERPSRGRTIAAELVDLNGDGRSDLIQAAFVSFPPTEERWFRAWIQDAAGGHKARDTVGLFPHFSSSEKASDPSSDLVIASVVITALSITMHYAACVPASQQRYQGRPKQE